MARHLSAGPYLSPHCFLPKKRTQRIFAQMQGVYESLFYRRERIKKKKQSAFYAIIKEEQK